jgi:hypothetical protein
MVGSVAGRTHLLQVDAKATAGTSKVCPKSSSEVQVTII